DARDTYWAGRMTLCATPDDLAVYDAAFAAYFGGFAHVKGLPLPVPPKLPRPATPWSGAGAAGGDAADVPGRISMSGSGAEVLRHRDVSTLSAVERDDVRRMIALLAVGTSMRPGRRRAPARRGEVDVARTIRRALAAGGEAAPLAHHRRRPRP